MKATLYRSILGTFGSGRGGGLFVAGLMLFGLGFAASTSWRPRVSTVAWPTIAAGAPSPERTVRTTTAQPGGYPAEVQRVIDGDTFEARVRVWPGLDVNTKVRLRNIDAPELHARCADESMKAQAARAALESMLAAGGVTLSQVGLDKYGGRIDALVATRDTADVSAALLDGGFARSYDGGRRGSWC